VQGAHDGEGRRARSPGLLLEEGLQQQQQQPNSRRRRLRPRQSGDAKDSAADEEDQTLIGGSDAGSTPVAASDGLPQGRRRKRSLRSGLAAGATRGSSNDDLEPDDAELAISEADLHRGPPLVDDDSVSRFLAAADFRDGTAAVTLSAAEANRFLHQGPAQRTRRLNFLPVRHSTAAPALPRRLVYVESAASGLFHRLLEPAVAAHHLTDSSSSSDSSSAIALTAPSASVHAASLGVTGNALLHTAAAAAAAASSHATAHAQPAVSQSDLAAAKGDALLASVWAFCQGLLAGVALLPLFQAHMAFNGAAAAAAAEADGSISSDNVNTGRAQFLFMYQAAANETRRLLFILSALGFTGALDLCAQVRTVSTLTLWLQLTYVTVQAVRMIG
jgi:hypothetical protein